MRTTTFLGLQLPEYTNDADIEELNTIFELFEDVHKDSVNFYSSAYTSNLITLSNTGGKYPREYIDSMSAIMSSPVDLSKGQTGIKIKIGTIGTGASIDLEIMNEIKNGDFCFIKYYQSSNKFRVTSYYQDLKTALSDIADIKNGYNFTGTTQVNGSNVLTMANKSDSVTSTSSNTIATSKAVKSSYDRGSTGITNAATAQSSANTAQARADSAYTLAGTKEPKIVKKSGFNLDKSDVVNSTSGTILATSRAVKTAYDKGVDALNRANSAYSLAGGKEPTFSKNNAFNKNFGTSSGTIAQGNDSRIVNAVPKVRTVNGKPLSSNVVLSSGDVGAYTKAEVTAKFALYYKKTDKVANATRSDSSAKADSATTSTNATKLNSQTNTSNATASTVVSRDSGGHSKFNNVYCNKLVLNGYEITVV